jgi:hypothetical protein
MSRAKFTVGRPVNIKRAAQKCDLSPQLKKCNNLSRKDSQALDLTV